MKRAFRLLMIVALLPLAGCGFTPLYAKHESRADAAMRAIPPVRVEARIGDRIYRQLAQHFEQVLEDRLHPDSGGMPLHPEYTLSADLTVTETPVAVSRDGTVSRYNVNVQATLRLQRIADGAEVYKGTARRVSSYNNEVNAYYSTYVAAQDARERATTALAEDVELRLAAYFSGHPAAVAAPPVP